MSRGPRNSILIHPLPLPPPDWPRRPPAGRTRSRASSSPGSGSEAPPCPPENRLCQVCKVVPYQFFHFGAFVCNRCRAFFRRHVRRDRKSDGSSQRWNECFTTHAPLEGREPICDITAFRGACPACRFATCLNVGMNTEAVLSDEARDEKYSAEKRIKRQQEQLERNNADIMMTDQSGSSDSSPQQSTDREQRKTSASKKKRSRKSSSDPPKLPLPPPSICNGTYLKDMDGYFDAIIVPMGESMSSGIPKNPDDPAPKRISRSKVEGLQTFCDQMTNHWVQPTPTPQAASFSDSNGYPMQSQYYYRGPVVEPPWLESRGPSHPFNSWMYQEPFIWTQDSPRPAWPDTPPPEDPFPPPFNPVSPSFFSDQTMMNPSPALETAAPNLDQRRTIDDYDNFDDFCGNPGVSTILGDDHGTLDAAGEILMDLPLPNVDDILGSGSSNSEKNSPSQSSDIGPDIPQSLWTPDYNLDTTAFDERFNLASGLSMFNNFSQEL